MRFEVDTRGEGNFMNTQTGICVGKTTVECYIKPDAMHGGYGVKVIRTIDSSQHDEYYCALAMRFDQAEKLANHLHEIHAMPDDAELLIEDWMYDHADAAVRVERPARRRSADDLPEEDEDED